MPLAEIAGWLEWSRPAEEGNFASKFRGIFRANFGSSERGKKVARELRNATRVLLLYENLKVYFLFGGNNADANQILSRASSSGTNSDRYPCIYYT